MVEGGEQRSRRGHGSLEAAVLHFLREVGQPSTAGEVRAWLNAEARDGLAYTTVVTVLSRLYEKGLLDRLKQGRSFAYIAVADEARLTAQRLKNVLDHGPDREAVLAHFVGELSARDAALLRRLIASEPPGERVD
jgi:predicted transcriptional regulator